MFAKHVLTEDDIQLLIYSKTPILPSEICVFRFSDYMEFAKKKSARIADVFSSGTPTPEVYKYIISIEMQSFLKIVITLNDKFSTLIIPEFPDKPVTDSDNILMRLYNTKKFDSSFNYLGNRLPEPFKNIIAEVSASLIVHPDIISATKNYDFVKLLENVEQSIATA